VESSAAAPGVPFGYLAGSSVPSPPGRAPYPGPPASLTADRPRAGGAADTGGGPVKPGQCPRIGGHPDPWSRAVATPAGSLHSHEGQAPTPGQVTPWCPVLPGRFHPACPLSGDAWPAGSS